MSNIQLSEGEGGRIENFLEREDVKEKFKKMLGERAPAFLTSILQVVAGSDKLKAASAASIYGAAATAATMDLPINQNLGFAWIVPYKGNAQFQMGYKGFIQLALRTGQYKKLNVVSVYESQFIKWNELTEDLEADFSKDPEGDIVGVCCFFKLINGFEKTRYWTKKKILEHAKKYSKSFDHKDGQWQNNFEDMALKTVIKSTLSKWGILSIEMQTAMRADQGIIRDGEGQNITYEDNTETPEDKAKKAESEAEEAIKKAAAKAGK